MISVVLDGGQIPTREAAYDQLEVQLGLQAWGRNLDALYDVLTGGLSAPVCLTVRRRAALEAALGTYGAALLQTLAEAAAENPALRLVYEEG